MQKVWHCVQFVVFLVIFAKTKSQDTPEIVEAIVGADVDMPCNVTAEAEDDHLNILAWYKDGSSTAFYSSRDQREEDDVKTRVAGKPSRYRYIDDGGIATLTISSISPADAGVYYCLADFANSPALKTFVELKVIEPPEHLWVVYENGTRLATAKPGSNASKDVGPYYVGDTVRLYCIAYGGKPTASLSWWTEQRLIKDTLTPLSEQRIRSDLIYGPLQREDHGRVLTCHATNNDNVPPLSIDVAIDMFLPPELVSLRSEPIGGRAKAGEIIKLECRVLGARPLPSVIWRLNEKELQLEQNVTLEPTLRLLASQVSLLTQRHFDEARVTCCVDGYKRDTEQYVCAPALPLIVTYLPVLYIAVNGLGENNTVAVVKGSNLVMNCSWQANPPVYHLVWFHDSDLDSRDKSEDTVQQTLELTNVTERDAGEYVCGATNDEGASYSDPLYVDVTYPPYCVEEISAEYGLSENEPINITCNVKSNPPPTSYHWVLVNDRADVDDLKKSLPHTVADTDGPVLEYTRPADTPFTTIFCWGVNDVPSKDLRNSPCIFVITDETVPRPPSNCVAVKNALRDITVTCEKGHDGGLPQKFTFVVKSESGDQIMSVTNVDPKFIVQEPSQEDYKFEVVASNDKGHSEVVEIPKASIEDDNSGGDTIVSAVPNITTLALSLCGGVLLIVLCACGIVLCAHERSTRTQLPRSDPPLCAYNTEESNCETFNDSDDSECNVRRTESFRRAVSKYPSKYDVRRTSSFHSARYLHDMADLEGVSKCNEGMRHNSGCRVHSMQNISRKRDMDALCDHLVMQLPREPTYNVAKPMNTFYTMPRKTRAKTTKEISDENSEITQNSDQFSLPPPPDEYTSYRPGPRIKDTPSKPYSTHQRKNSLGKISKQYNEIISPMNTVGLPTISGHASLYTYPDDDQSRQATKNPFDDDSP